MAGQKNVAFFTNKMKKCYLRLSELPVRQTTNYIFWRFNMLLDLKISANTIAKGS